MKKRKTKKLASTLFKLKRINKEDKVIVKEETKEEVKSALKETPHEPKEATKVHEINVNKVTFSDEIKQKERPKNTCPMSTKSKRRMEFKDNRLGKYSFNMKTDDKQEIKINEDEKFVSFKIIPEVKVEESIHNINTDSLNQIMKIFKNVKKRNSNCEVFNFSKKAYCKDDNDASKQEDGTLKGIESKVRLNLLKTITEGIKSSQIAKSKFSKKNKNKKIALVESNSEKSIDKPDTAKFVNEDDLNRVITFSSELAKFAKKGTSSESMSCDPFVEFDENSNVNEKMRDYGSEALPYEEIELCASKQIMNIENVNEKIEKVGASTTSRRHMSEGIQLQIFGLNSLEKPQAKTLEEKESPKFSTWSENEEIKSRLSSKKREFRSIKLSTFSSQKIKAPKVRKVKRCLLVDNDNEMTSLFKMVCQALNCKLEIVCSNDAALEKVEDSINDNLYFKTIFININNERIKQYSELIHSIRDLESDNIQDSIPICCFTDGEPHNIITDLADDGVIDEPYSKPIKQDMLIDYILN